MDPSSSNCFRFENKLTPEPPTWEIGTNPCMNLLDEHSSQELDIIQVAHQLENPVLFSNGAKERSFNEALGKKYTPSTQQESHSEAMDNYNVMLQEFDGSASMYTDDENLASDMAKMEIMTNTMMQPSGAKIHSKKRNYGEKIEVIDLRALLIDCSKYVSSGDHLTANDLLSQIRQNSSPHGNGEQRLSHYFANGLELRLAGTCSKIHVFPTSSDYSGVRHLSLAISPMTRISNFASNETILIKSKKATKIHVIDFGILYGIQWPSFIRRMAGREGGPLEKLRITGVEFPQMAGIIEDTGRRLARYAEMLGVPFEYKSIAREWETIKIEDLKIDKDEFVAVVCSVRSMRLMDDMVGEEESPRFMFIELIKQINPNIFVHGIINGAFNQPLFVYRFRELMLHFLAVFDMLETLVPRETPERIILERDLIGKDILNVIACEGLERVIRPETCRQWQVRHLKAGFMKVPFERKLIDAIMCKVNDICHRDFSIFEENRWMMISWKGRAIFAISCWQPAVA